MVIDDGLPRNLTYTQFEAYCKPRTVKYGTVVQLPTLDHASHVVTLRTIELVRVMFADGRHAAIGFDEVEQQWWWRPIERPDRID